MLRHSPAESNCQRHSAKRAPADWRERRLACVFAARNAALRPVWPPSREWQQPTVRGWPTSCPFLAPLPPLANRRSMLDATRPRCNRGCFHLLHGPTLPIHEITGLYLPSLSATMVCDSPTSPREDRAL